MIVVLDANVVAATILPLPYSDQATDALTSWGLASAELHAPLLLQYELTSTLRKAVVAGWMTSDGAADAMRTILDLSILCHAPTFELHESAQRWADRLGQSNAYDAHYLALANELRADMWTADKRLATGARQSGVDWVRWIGELGGT